MENKKITGTVSRIPTSHKDARLLSLMPKPGEQLRPLLRRRSKSTTDLRANSRPLLPLNSKTRTFAQNNVQRVAPKRPAAPAAAEVKPKVAKVAAPKKIPSWDLKGRLAELQERYNKLQAEFKLAEENGSKYEETKLELENIKAEMAIKIKQLVDLKMSNAEMSQEIQKIAPLQLENDTIKQELAEIKGKYKQLKIDFEENASKCTKLETANANLKAQLEADGSLINDMKDKLEQHEENRRRMHNIIQDLKGNIRVFCRVRPPLAEEAEERTMVKFTFADESSLEIKKTCETSRSNNSLNQEFSFNRVFPPNTAQEVVFEDVSDLVQSSLDGYNVCVFAYGQTGSGKTFTMQGTETNPGIIPRTIKLIFQKINQLKEAHWSYSISASFLEIYNEQIRDLLNPNSSANCDIRFNEGKGTTVTNLKIMPVQSEHELRQLMTKAQRNRAVAATNFNLHSSRSHAVTKIYLAGMNKVNKLELSGSINLVDLAGSESAKTSSNERIQETKNINRSLSILGKVMGALVQKESHIPYRDSKLTYLLSDSLGGNSKTLMFVNIAPFDACYGESINSLRFASKVKEVKITAKRICK